MFRKSNFFKDALFKPSVIRYQGTKTTITLSDAEQDTFANVYSTGSFRFDPEGSPLKNTQQLNVDFSKFENHTFFNSAKNKVQIAFEKIINQYPFDGTRKEYEDFFDKISGFEKFVYDKFPKNTGFLIFDRPILGEAGNYLNVEELIGLQEKSQNVKGEKQLPLSITDKPFTFEVNLFIPSGTVNYNEIIAQRIINGNAGYTLAVSESSGMSSPFGECNVSFILSDGNKSAKVETKIEKGVFNHIAAIYDRGTSNKLKILLNGLDSSYSENSIFLDKFDFDGKHLTIGSGSNHTYSSGSTFVAEQTLSGALDDFRFFNSSRQNNDIRKYNKREIFAQSDLKLYFKFNEPSGSYSYGSFGNENLCLDSSGNGMHTLINNFNMSQRNTSRVDAVSLIEEDLNSSPVLFPAYEEVRNLSLDLIQSASNYDLNNPNMITNLIPMHYLVDEQNYLGFESETGDLEKQPDVTSNKPGGNKIQQSQLITSVLFMWAETFDQIKLYIDELSRLLKVDQKDKGTISDQLLPFLAEYYGVSLPTQFNAATIEQTLQGRNVTLSSAQANRTLQDIQNVIWKRILSDLPMIRKSKGTRESVEATLRNIGINPGTTFRIREYGGPFRKEIQNSYEKRTHIGRSLSFSGSLGNQGVINGEGRDSNRPLLTSHYLSSSRTEPGDPIIKGVFVGGVSNDKSDGLFTSSSWHCEGLFKLPSNKKHLTNQSLMRIQTTGSTGGVGNTWSLFNVVATSPDKGANVTGSLTLYGKPDGNKSQLIELRIDDIDLFDGGKWNISFGRDASTKDAMSSSYYLRAGKSRFVKEALFYSTSVYYGDKTSNALNTINSEFNASGAFVTVGSMSLGYNPASSLSFLNQEVSKFPKIVDFSGEVSNLRFFSKAMSEEETIVHVENPKSLGVKNPILNFNFNTEDSGSFERLRIDYSMEQIHTDSNGSGQITIFDFTQNQFFGSGTGFESEKQVIFPSRLDYRILSPKLDLRSSDNKVRVRSYKDKELVLRERVQVAPIYNIPLDEIPLDDKRVEVEVSAVQALNDDIILLFSALDYFDNAIGDPELVFASEYKTLRNLRKVYFNRITEKMSLTKFFTFFKWFDDTVGDIIEGLIPRSARYLGTNFVIESHSLERNKFVYNYTDMYLGELERPNPGEIYVQQIIGLIKKR